MKKTTYIIEKAENYIKTEIIDEQENGSSTSSSVTINKDCISLQMQ